MTWVVFLQKESPRRYECANFGSNLSLIGDCQTFIQYNSEEIIKLIHQRECTVRMYPRECTVRMYPRECTVRMYPRECTVRMYPRECSVRMYPENLL